MDSQARTETGLPDFGSRKRISLVVSILSVGLAITYLLGAILLLYWVEDPNKRLGILSALIVSFAGSLAIFTNARRQDVLASTAGYAAVLVVFVSGELGSNPAKKGSASHPNIPGTTSRNIVTMTTTVGHIATVTSTPDLHQGPKIALGIGIGLGLPAIFGIFAACIFCLMRGRKERRSWVATRS